MRTAAVSLVATLMISVLAASPAEWGGPGRDSGPVNIQKPPVKSAKPPANASKPLQSKRLKPFASEAELEAYLRKIAEEQRRQRRSFDAGIPAPSAAPGVATAAPAAPQASAARSAEAGAADSITNVQHAGVDEGGIVKMHRNHLVVLRRGRLFTVAIGGNDLRPVSVVDAFAPDINPAGTWYDEMLVANDTVVVIGYSYARGGTEIGLFDIDASGKLQYRSTYHLRSNDYYSSRNYSSRLLGTKLVFYTPLYLGFSEDIWRFIPALRKWHTGAQPEEFRRIAPASRIYRPVDADPSGRTTLHTVTICDLARRDFDCAATVVVGPSGRVFYVSPQNVYVWTTDWRGRGTTSPPSTLYQLPLDGSAPGALKVVGSPVDQFSFLESEDAHLNVLVRSDAGGEGMWRPEVAAGDVALMRVARDSFSDGTTSVPVSNYRPLPRPEGYTFQNRFVGKYLLYGTGSGWGRQAKAERTRFFAVQWAGPALFDLGLSHTVDRIEAMGSDAVVVGTNGADLLFTAVRLGDVASLAGGFTRPGASQSELRSHGFFYRPESASGGLLGLPITRPGRPGYRHLIEGSASILFLRNNALRFTELGELDAQPDRAVDDKCRASCVDWYGNARPLFIGTRVFALMGYEIVEGTLEGGRIRETRRINYAPPTRPS
jgi:hypothetical protein